MEQEKEEPTIKVSELREFIDEQIDWLSRRIDQLSLNSRIAECLMQEVHRLIFIKSKFCKEAK